MRLKGNRHSGELPRHLWVGVALLLVGELLILGRRRPEALFAPLDLTAYQVGDADINVWLRPVSDYWFAAVWFGYILVLDSYLYRRDGRSLIMSQRRVFLAMLPLSAALWWGFEWVNSFVHNWFYARPFDIPDWYANLWSCIFFSTVIPAVWETATLAAGWGWVQRLRTSRSFQVRRPVLAGLIMLGVLSFILPVVWPLYFYPLIWGFLALILDPINYWRGAPSILEHWARGDWRTPTAFYVGGLICGVLWEFWNYWAFPKWYYNVPFLEFGHIFEMPLLGYLGYGPFAWELYAFFWFAATLVRRADLAMAGLRPEFEGN